MRWFFVTLLAAAICHAQDSRAHELNAEAQAAATGRPQDTARVRSLVLSIERDTRDPAEAVSLTILGAQLSGAGEFKEARDTLERALALATQFFGKDSREASTAALRLADLLVTLGDPNRAQALGERALAALESRFGPNDPHVSEALVTLASVCMAGDRYADAITFSERAIRIEETALGPSSRTLGATLTRFAFALYAAGDLARAKLIAERAIAILDSGTTAPGRRAGDARRVMGDILVSLGDYAAARAAQDRALAIFENWFGPDSVEVADDLAGMGSSAREAGDLQRARDLTERVVRIYEKVLGPENPRVGGSLDNLGQTLALMKDWEGARNCFERALSIQIKALGPRSPWTANLYQGLAKVAAGTGRFADAEDLLRKNINIWREQLGPAHPFTAVSLNLLANVLAHRGNRTEALQTAIEAARLRREEVAYTVRTVDERQALQFAARKSRALDTALSLAAGATPTETAAMWDETIRARALVLDEMAARNRAARASKDPAMARLISEESRARSELARLAVQGKGSMTLSAWQQTLDAKRDAVYRADQALAVSSAPYRESVAREHAGWHEAAQALPSGSAVVAYVRYSRTDFSVSEDRSAAAYLAFVLRRGEPAPHVVLLGSAAPIEAQAKALRAEIAYERDSAGHSQRRNEAAYRAAGETLRRSVWDPAARLIAGSSSVYLIPDGALQLVNFAALPLGANQYLAESGPLLHTLSAERDLVDATTPLARNTSLLAVGNPTYDNSPTTIHTATPSHQFRSAHSGCGDFSRLRFEALPGSAREAAAIAAIWKEKGWTAETLLGPRASESSLKELVSGRRVLHIATHGFFLEDQCEGSGILAENPLLRSGLALAAANRREAAPPNTDDGILTAEEAASLDLGGTEWVVLSGCDTGLGDLRAGEGVLGLRRAFQEAGAGSVIGSLWPVEDESAAQWMANLYRAHFQQGQSTAQAVRTAHRQALTARRAKGLSTHPFYWASFVAVERR